MSADKKLKNSLKAREFRDTRYPINVAASMVLKETVASIVCNSMMVKLNLTFSTIRNEKIAVEIISNKVHISCIVRAIHSMEKA